MLSVVKHLSVSKNVNRHADLEIFRFAQDDMAAYCHAEHSEASPRCVCSLFVGYKNVTRKVVGLCRERGGGG